ncbi:hypothetical protein [Caproicibacterium sp. BJN0003]|uniref:hypothetical protein n=1 Tax=Caproicibacterium sp. BJN0003 TaxID=2994078 RepID=UPI0022583441|nr:hypothetical protein [Caproicibacterium sp. BJN0003]UZT82130.1 hypothetical protein OP489_11790 [Caproicibacterium sp. BJN0003]
MKAKKAELPPDPNSPNEVAKRLNAVAKSYSANISEFSPNQKKYIWGVRKIYEKYCAGKIDVQQAEIERKQYQLAYLQNGNEL